MIDRELLEFAAKAAGLDVWFPRMADGKGGVLEPCHRTLNGETVEWNPLTDDGDALRLAVTLGLVVDCSRPSAGEPWKQHHIWLDELCDVGTLTRRAIVRAAAEIGKGIQ
jgi:hypothetical protein